MRQEADEQVSLVREECSAKDTVITSLQVRCQLSIMLDQYCCFQDEIRTLKEQLRVATTPLITKTVKHSTSVLCEVDCCLFTGTRKSKPACMVQPRQTGSILDTQGSSLLVGKFEFLGMSNHLHTVVHRSPIKQASAFKLKDIRKVKSKTVFNLGTLVTHS